MVSNIIENESIHVTDKRVLGAFEVLNGKLSLQAHFIVITIVIYTKSDSDMQSTISSFCLHTHTSKHHTLVHI